MKKLPIGSTVLVVGKDGYECIEGEIVGYRKEHVMVNFRECSKDYMLRIPIKSILRIEDKDILVTRANFMNRYMVKK